MKDLIFGYTWEAIQRAQQGGQLSEPIGVQKSVNFETRDAELLAKHGMEGLKTLGLFGVIDRLASKTK